MSEREGARKRVQQDEAGIVGWGQTMQSCEPGGECYTTCYTRCAKQEAVTVSRQRDGGLYYNVSRGDEKRDKLGCILKVECSTFANGLG